jgi:hypothetical protein
MAGKGNDRVITLGEEKTAERPAPVPLWEKENPLTSLIPIVGPYVAKLESGLTAMSVLNFSKFASV